LGDKTRAILEMIYMCSQITRTLFNRVGITGIYFGKALDSVPPGSLVFFPYLPGRINCGITAVLSFKKSTGQKDDGETITAFVKKVKGLLTHSWEALEKEGGIDQTSYLGRKNRVEEAGKLCERLKGKDIFYQIFSDKTCEEELSSLSNALETGIGQEERFFAQKKGELPAGVYQEIALRMIEVKDIHWALKHDILENVEKMRSLGCTDRFDTPPQAVYLLKETNLILNNLDRLEVRGRDSAGISLLLVLDKEVFEKFRQDLDSKDLTQEWEDRTEASALLNRTVRNRDLGDAGISLAFSYKTAAEIGGLGDNVRFLRKQITEDMLLQHVIRLSHKDHSVLAHTRWASCGEISVANCHPVDNVPGTEPGIIHVCLNGDIDNYQELRREFEQTTGKSIPPEITTDTKIIPLRIEKYLSEGHALEEAFRLAVNSFQGSHAIAMHSDVSPGKIFLAQKGSGQAIFVGLANDHFVPASEIYGFVEETFRYLKMDGEKTVEGKAGPTQGQIFVLNGKADGNVNGIQAMYYDGTPIVLSEKDIQETEINSRDIDRQHYPHYFLKEISESPRSVEQTIQGHLAVVRKNGKRCPQVLLDETVIPRRLEDAFKTRKIRKIYFIGQGTAGVAASACTVLMRDYLNGSDIRVASFKASEFSGFMLNDKLDDTLLVAISQSGTTTDTNRAVDMARNIGAHTMAIVNRRDSDITFKVDGVLYTSTGRDIEMSVASTKAYYSQIVAGAILGLKIAQLCGSRPDDFILAEIEHLWKLPTSMKQVLEKREEIRLSAEKYAVTKTYWASVGSGPNKVSADEIRIKLSALCYKSISSDVVEDKKHIDLSSEPLIFVCAAGNREDVLSDIVKDTAIFKAHEAVPIVVTTEGEHRFDPYADSVICVPQVAERLAPVLNTLVGHLWGYHAALAINEESQYLHRFREEMREYIDASVEKGLDVYEIVLDKTFREKAARFYTNFKNRIKQNRYATAMAIHAASDLTLLLKYLAGRLPINDFEFDFGTKGTAPQMLETFFRCIGKIINEMARPVDAIKHQAKTVTVGTSRISEKVGGLLFKALEEHGFSQHQMTASNVLVLRHLQEVAARVKGTTVYKIHGLNILGEPTDDATIDLVYKTGSAEKITSRVETDNRLRGTKRIIIKNSNIFIGKGKRDKRSILAVPIMTTGTRIDHLVLFNVEFKKDVELEKKVNALGGKFRHIRNLVEETSLTWKDSYLHMLEVEELFGISAEKISEKIIATLKENGSNNSNGNT